MFLPTSSLSSYDSVLSGASPTSLSISFMSLLERAVAEELTLALFPSLHEPEPPGIPHLGYGNGFLMGLWAATLASPVSCLHRTVVRTPVLKPSLTSRSPAQTLPHSQLA